MEGLELISFELISNVGAARSSFVEAIHYAKKGEFEAATQSIKEGDNYFKAGHKVHRELVEKEVNGEKTEFSIILMHAEDQLMSADGFKIIAEEIIDIYKHMQK